MSKMDYPDTEPSWAYDRAPTDPRHGGKLTADMAAARIADLEGDRSVARLQLAARVCSECPAQERVAALEVSVRRGIAQIERLLPYVQWDGMEGEQDEINANVTLDLMREAVAQ